jgi:Gram-negative bacterial TonB protein C-terminal
MLRRCLYLCAALLSSLVGCTTQTTYRSATGELVARTELDRHYELLILQGLGGVVVPEIKFDRFERPRVGFQAKPGDMYVRVRVDPKSGSISDVRVTSNTSDDKSAEMLVEAISQWKLKPFTRNGSDKSVDVIFPIRVR